MVLETSNQTQVTEEERALSTKIEELDGKVDKSDAEKTELKDLKQKRHSSFNKRLGELNYRAKSAEEQLAEEKRLREEDKTRWEEEKSKQPKPEPKIVKETVEAGEKTFFTDKALDSMVRAGKMTQADALEHQSERIEEVAADKAYNRIRKEDKKNENLKIAKEDAQSVLKKHPEFDNKHASHNANDPVYKLANELYAEGLSSNPRGFSIAVKRAKQILGKTNANIDLSTELNINSPSAPNGKEPKDKEYKLKEEEKDVAISMYRNKINLQTNKPYTDAESIAKYAKAMGSRPRRIV